MRATCKEVECINSEGVPDTLLVFRIEPGERVHEMKNGDTYANVRLGELLLGMRGKKKIAGVCHRSVAGE